MAIVYQLQDHELSEKLRAVRTERYACQSVARKAVPNERVGMCLRRINGSNVKVLKHQKTSKAFYDGLLVCGSVWLCPVCAAKISERRKLEIKQAFDIHKSEGGNIAMLTLTFSHKKKDRLKETIQKFGKATTKFMSGRAFNDIRLEMNLIGRIRVFEVTYGANGFHPHVHIALFYKNEIDLYKIKLKMFELWEKACEKFEIKTTLKHGIDLQGADEAEAYLSKHGTWSLEQELSKSHIKKAKNESMTPFDFLRKYLETEDEKLLHLFREYMECFKGKRQIQWSQGLKKRFVLVEKTDEELAKEKVEEADALGMLSYSDWKQILKLDQRSLFLDRVEKFGFENAYMITIKKESSATEDSRVEEI